MAYSYAVLIPARFSSTRYPGKPLATLRGATGEAKTLVQRSWECAAQLDGCEGVWVATDDERIAAEVERFGGRFVMTSPDCINGTERCADSLDKLECDAEFIVNLQGDAPLTPAWLIPRLVEHLATEADLAITTPAVRCSRSTLAHLQADEAAGTVGGTTIVFNKASRALYFSKRILPFLPALAAGDETPVHLHLGLYAYRRSALRAYVEAPPSALELLEGLEQLRFLDEGLPVGTTVVDPLDWDSIELNNPSDVPVIEGILAARGIA